MKKLLLVLGGLSCALTIVISVYVRLEASFMDWTDRTNQLRIIDLSSSISHADFEMPIGSMRRFLISRSLSTQNEIDPVDQFAGRLTVEVDGRSVYSVAIDSDSAQECDWLERKGHLAEILDMDSPDVLDTIKEGTKCRVSIELEAEPEVDRAIWLSYVYRNGDLKKPKT